MNKYLTIAGSLALMFAVNANAALVVDTGTPDNLGASYSVDNANSLAGQVVFSQALTLNSIETYLVANDQTSAGAAFTISLYADKGNVVADGYNDSPILSTTATYTADGWNGAFGLNWSVDAGTYWIAIEESNGETFSATQKVANPLAHTAYNYGGYNNVTGSYYFTSPSAIQFGLRVDAVPEADTYAMLLAGLGVMGVVARRRYA